MANIDTQGNVHPDQFWQDVRFGNVKQVPFSRIWDGRHEPTAARLAAIRSVGAMDRESRRAHMHGRCAGCRWFPICGGGFRTRAAIAHPDGFGSDPACYLRDNEIAEPESAPAFA